jgi:N-acetylglutamate synthase-like GNAT family acetyltransferase
MSYPTRRKFFEPKPLCWSTRKSAIDLLAEEFPKQQLLEKSKFGLTLSLMPSWASAMPLSIQGICNRKYWCITVNNKVIGVTGTYQRTCDLPNTTWLGKTCVAFAFQGHGLGTYLLDFAVQKSTEAGAGKLCVHITRRNNRAIQFFLRRGFRRFTSDSPKYKSDLVHLGLNISCAAEMGMESKRAA